MVDTTNGAQVEFPTLCPSLMIEALIKCFKALEPVLLKGMPGIGKTDIVKLACKMLGAKLFICHPVVDEPTDYKGFPFVVEGKAEFLPYGMLRLIIEAKKLTVVFLDDLGQAGPSVQAAAMQLLLGREINGKKVSDKVVFVAATNRKQDRAGVSGLLEPVKSRFLSILELSVDVSEWIEWGAANGQPSSNLVFIQTRPNLLCDFKPTADITNTPCPRTVAHCGRIIKMDFDPVIEHAMFAGAAGVAFATELSGFMRLARMNIDPHLALANPDTVDIPTQPDRRYALAGSIAEFVREDTMPNFVQLLSRMEPEYSVLAMTLARGRDKTLAQTRAFAMWAKDNTDIFN